MNWREIVPENFQEEFLNTKYADLREKANDNDNLEAFEMLIRGKGFSKVAKLLGKDEEMREYQKIIAGTTPNKMLKPVGNKNLLSKQITVIVAPKAKLTK